MSGPLEPDADVPARGVRVHASLPGAERRSRLASVLSFLLHAIIIYLAIRLTAAVALPTHSPIGDAILVALGGGGGGGGQRGAAFQHVAPPTPPKPAVVTVPPPPPTVMPPQVQAPVPPPPAPSTNPAAPGSVTAAGTGTGTGGGNGSGAGPGTGSGQGPGNGGGSGGGDGRGTPPDSRMLTVPEINGSVPKQYRNKPLEITFSLAADGRVLGYTITPPISDRGFAKRVDDALRAFTFRPAKDASGKPIPSTYVYTFTFGGS